MVPGGVDTASTDGTFDISNTDRLGKSEVELIQIVIDGVDKLIELEKELEKVCDNVSWAIYSRLVRANEAMIGSCCSECSLYIPVAATSVHISNSRIHWSIFHLISYREVRFRKCYPNPSRQLTKRTYRI